MSSEIENMDKRPETTNIDHNYCNTDELYSLNLRQHHPRNRQLQTILSHRRHEKI